MLEIVLDSLFIMKIHDPHEVVCAIYMTIHRFYPQCPNVISTFLTLDLFVIDHHMLLGNKLSLRQTLHTDSIFVHAQTWLIRGSKNFFNWLLKTHVKHTINFIKNAVSTSKIIKIILYYWGKCPLDQQGSQAPILGECLLHTNL